MFGSKPKPSPGTTPPNSATSAAYDRHKQRAAAAQAAKAAAGRDIGPIPPVADPRRRARAVKSLRRFCETYLAARFPLPFSDDHLEQLNAIEATVHAGGLQAVAAPRGDGKTTRLESGILWAVLIGAHRYAVILTAAGKHAPKRIASLKTELLTNDLLAADFPEICYPIRKMAGIANRCQGQNSEGRPTWPGGLDSPWGRRRFVLPTVAGSKAAGAIVEASGLLEAVRGLSATSPDGSIARPTLALIDDPQTDRSAKSPLQTEEREKAISAGILHLPGPEQVISALLSCTVIRPGDLADRMLDRDAHPAWHGIRKQMLAAFPEPAALELWDQYAEIYRGALAAGDSEANAATAFYRRNRRAMDAGAIVTWKHRKAPSEASALEHAMRLFIRDRATFFSEMQNAPEEARPEGAVQMLTADQLQQHTNAHAPAEVPTSARRLTFFVDVHKDLLYYAVAAWDAGFTGYLIAYGTWPPQPGHYFDHHNPRHTIEKHPAITATTLEGRTRQALDVLFSQLAAANWKTAAGTEYGLDFGMVDANWGETTNAVYQAARDARKRYGLRVTPSHGLPFGAAKCPISRYDPAKNRGAVIGDDWMLPSPNKCRAIQHAIFDAGRRKSFLWRRLATPPGDPGSLTFYHAPPARHRLLAEHLTAETGTQISGPWGELTAWTLQPGRPNHWLDCLSGCATAASIAGERLAPQALGQPAATPGPTAPRPPRKPSPPRQRVRYL